MNTQSIKVGDLVRHRDSKPLVGSSDTTAFVYSISDGRAVLAGCPGTYHVSYLRHAEPEAPVNPVPTTENLFVENGYSVHPASNGGFIVRKNNPDMGMVTDMAAFSNVTDMLVWLTKAHGIKE